MDKFLTDTYRLRAVKEGTTTSSRKISFRHPGNAQKFIKERLARTNAVALHRRTCEYTALADGCAAMCRVRRRRGSLVGVMHSSLCSAVGCVVMRYLGDCRNSPSSFETSPVPCIATSMRQCSWLCLVSRCSPASVARDPRQRRAQRRIAPLPLPRTKLLIAIVSRLPPRRNYAQAAPPFSKTRCGSSFHSVIICASLHHFLFGQ